MPNINTFSLQIHKKNIFNTYQNCIICAPFICSIIIYMYGDSLFILIKLNHHSPNNINPFQICFEIYTVVIEKK